MQKPPQNVPASAYISPCEAAALLGVSERTVWRWIRERRIASVKVGGSRRISRAALSSVLARRRAQRKRSYRRVVCPHCGEKITIAS